MDLTFLAATGFTALGIVLGALAEERLWWLLHRPLPRPRRRRVPPAGVPHAGWYVDRDRVRAGVRLEPPESFVIPQHRSTGR